MALYILGNQLAFFVLFCSWFFFFFFLFPMLSVSLSSTLTLNDYFGGKGNVQFKLGLAMAKEDYILLTQLHTTSASLNVF